MNTQDKDEVVIVPEIIVIKRKRGGEPAHHGGVWKIAYADFMTAMMAFFLVMWLINASNEETKAQVASYFNPVKLVDASTNPRGLNDKKGNDSTTNKKSNEVPPATKPLSGENVKQETGGLVKNGSGKKMDREEKLLQKPLKMLNEIVLGAKGAGTRSSKAQKRASIEHQYRDPFAPKSWKVLEVKTKPRSNKSMSAKQVKKPSLDKKTNAEAKKTKSISKKAKLAAMKKLKKKVKILTVEEKPEKFEKKLIKSKTPQLRMRKKVQKLLKDISVTTKNTDLKGQPSVNVTNTSEGILISLTDKAEFGMFNVASAKPTRELVLFMEKIAKVLSKRSAKLVIRGHTDARPFHSEKYDNWRLSTARAQIARFMLIRGGIPETRFARIVGYADRKLLLPEKPFDARNRRIEILLLEE